MKKLVLFTTIFFLPFYTKAQNDSIKNKNPFELGWSVYAGTFGTIPLVGLLPVSRDINIRPYTSLFFSPSFDIYGKRIHGHIQYDFGGNAFCFIGGYLMNNNIDIYTIVQKRVSTSERSLGFGVEKVVESKICNLLIFSEFDFDVRSDRYDLSIGILIQRHLMTLRQDTEEEIYKAKLKSLHYND